MNAGIYCGWMFQEIDSFQNHRIKTDLRETGFGYPRKVINCSVNARALNRNFNLARNNS